MRHRQTTRFETLGGLARQGVGVLVSCLACNRYVSMKSVALIARLGDGYPVPAVAARTRCGRCGRRGDESRPDWRVECLPDLSHLRRGPDRTPAGMNGD